MVYNFTEEDLELTDEEINTFTIVKRVLLYSICSFGAPANIMSFAILSFPQMKSPMNCCLQFLAVFDTLFLLSFYFTMNNVAAGYILMGAYVMLTGSVWMVVLVSMERFVAVCYPLKTRYLFTYKRTVLCCSFIAVCAILINSPRWFLTESGSAVSTVSEFQVYLAERFGLEEFPMLTERDVHIVQIFGWFETVYLFAVPMVLLSFFNISIFISVKKSAKKHREMTHTQKSEIKLSNTVIGIVIVFFVSGVPLLIYKCVCYTGIIRYSLFVKIFTFVDPIVSANSAANFVVYFALTPNFRGIFFRIFHYCSCRRKENPQGNVTPLNEL